MGIGGGFRGFSGRFGGEMRDFLKIYWLGFVGLGFVYFDSCFVLLCFEGFGKENKGVGSFLYLF